jgi:hypothetical protein
MTAAMSRYLTQTLLTLDRKNGCLEKSRKPSAVVRSQFSHSYTRQTVMTGFFVLEALTKTISAINF